LYQLFVNPFLVNQPSRNTATHIPANCEELVGVTHRRWWGVLGGILLL